MAYVELGSNVTPVILGMLLVFVGLYCSINQHSSYFIELLNIRKSMWGAKYMQDVR